MSAPIIGLTTFHTRLPKKSYVYLAVTEAYVRAVIAAGGIPILIPLGVPDLSLRKLLDRVEGVLFTGGGDLAPNLYGGQSQAPLDDVDPERDRVELFLVREVVERQIPFLGICRGMQTINVALGGTLYTDIRRELPQALKHDCFKVAPRDHLAHAIRVQESSQLAKIIDRVNAEVNSGHHQAICQLAPGLEATAHAPDGLLEALELPNHVFGLAVQWHPEWLTHLPENRALFQALVRAAENRLRLSPG